MKAFVFFRPQSAVEAPGYSNNRNAANFKAAQDFFDARKQYQLNRARGHGAGMGVVGQGMIRKHQNAPAATPVGSPWSIEKQIQEQQRKQSEAAANAGMRNMKQYVNFFYEGTVDRRVLALHRQHLLFRRPFGTNFGLIRGLVRSCISFTPKVCNF